MAAPWHRWEKMRPRIQINLTAVLHVIVPSKYLIMLQLIRNQAATFLSFSKKSIHNKYTHKSKSWWWLMPKCTKNKSGTHPLICTGDIKSCGMHPSCYSTQNSWLTSLLSHLPRSNLSDMTINGQESNSQRGWIAREYVARQLQCNWSPPAVHIKHYVITGWITIWWMQ